MDHELQGIIIVVLIAVLVLALIIVQIFRCLYKFAQGYEAGRYPNGRPILAPAEEEARLRGQLPWFTIAGAIVITIICAQFPFGWPIAFLLYARLFFQIRLAYNGTK